MALDLFILGVAVCVTAAIVVVVAWSLYNLFVALTGLAGGSSRQEMKDILHETEARHSFSIIVPVKDEEVVLPRLINSVIGLRYPKSKYEVLLVEDGSVDGTAELCAEYARHYPETIRYIHLEYSDGKPSALNAALQSARGEIVGVLDADSVADTDLLLVADKMFSTRDANAIQGMPSSINPGQNMLTRVASLEEAAWFGALMRGKERLGLFVPLTGSCQFVRASDLRQIGGWDAHSLAEDVDLAARIVENGGKVGFAAAVSSKQETPSSLSQLVRQRIRWYRGYMESALRYGRLIRIPSRVCLDAELTLMGPYILSASLFAYGLSLALCFFDGGSLLQFPAWIMTSITTVVLLALGLALMFMVKPRRLSNLAWVPLIYAYWCLQGVIATCALGLMVLRRPRVWSRTRKTGSVTDPLSKDQRLRSSANGEVTIG
jgi:cellulose synthase/poly-beta-1,6-N-acetylglucosamine synthase-like glycosyltransferase